MDKGGMINSGKFPILGVNINAVDYEFTIKEVVQSAKAGRPCSVSALAVHGVMSGFQNKMHARRLNGLDLTVPDGQPVRWALKWLHGIALPDRVYGPNLTLYLCNQLANENLSIYLYGSKREVLDSFSRNLLSIYPKLKIAGAEPSKFRKLNRNEQQEVVHRIRASGAQVVFVGLGCPRQEVWAFEYRNLLRMPIVAVGAAFDFHAGTLPQAPKWLQDRGMEWCFRLFHEPRRLWRRYLLLNPAFLIGIVFQLINKSKSDASYPDGTEFIEGFG